MKKVTVNFWIDLISFITFLGLTVTGVVIRYVLPPGTGGRGKALSGGRGTGDIKELLNMTRHEWGDIHFYIAIVFFILILLHIILHWQWIKNYFSRNFLKRRKTDEPENI